MRTKKTLIAVGLASTLGAGAAFAASTPYPASVDDAKAWINGPSETTMIHDFSGVGATSLSAGGSIGGTVSSLNDDSMSSDQLQLSSASDEDQTLTLADQGTYSDYYVVSAVPVESWDYYALTPVFDTSSESIAYMPTYLGSDLALMSFDSSAM